MNRRLEKEGILNLSSEKVAIISFITHSSHLNYGATLHGYAFQQYLLKYGVDSIVIDYIPKVVAKDNLKYPILNDDSYRPFIKRFAIKLNWLIGFRANIRRYSKFKDFVNKRIRKTSKIYKYSSLLQAEEIDGRSFPIFVCESDVIWKVTSEETIDENFFLKFPAAEGHKKIAYAPTISSKMLSDKFLDKLKSLISDFDAISAREKQGAEYLAELTNREVPWVLDPTLLLHKEDYDEIETKPLEDRYLLIYNVTENDIKMVKEAVKFAKKHQLRPVEISNYALNRFVVPHTVKVGVGIEEWIGYIKNADVIVTNSFHGFCFSVLYHRDVYLFQRNNEDYKMQNIAESLGMKHRLISHLDKIIPETSVSINWIIVDKLLNERRITSHEYLVNNIIRYCK